MWTSRRSQSHLRKSARRCDVAGLPEGKGIGLSARIVDDAASRPPRSRAWTGAGTCVLGQPGAGHGLQDSRSGGGEAAQGALLPGAARSRVCGKNGRSAVRLSQGEAAEECRSRVEEEAE